MSVIKGNSGYLEYDTIAYFKHIDVEPVMLKRRVLFSRRNLPVTFNIFTVVLKQI